MQKEESVKQLSDLRLPNGTRLYTQEYIQSLRNQDTKHPGSVRAYIAQKGAQENMLSANVDILICGGSRGGPLDENTVVLTPNGFVKIKDIKIGDYVIGSDGEKHEVLQKQSFGLLPSVKVHFVDGANVVCSDDHAWTVSLYKGSEFVTKNAFLAKDIEHYLDEGYRVSVQIPRVPNLDQNCGWASERERIDKLFELITTTGEVRPYENEGFKWTGTYDTKAEALDVKYLVDSTGSVAYLLKTGEFEYTVTFNTTYREKERFIEGIDKTTDRVCYCLHVDAEDCLFIVNDFILTHNSKSFSLLMEALKDINNPNFQALLLRKETKDLDSLVSDSYKLYSDFGVYNKSLNDMTWNFNNGGWLKFSYYAGAYQAFKDRFQGRQYAYIGIDEITQCDYKKFKYLTTVNRNASHIRSRFWGTCNPDPDSWVRKFIDWWIDEDGYAIPERCGKVRYCYMDGDSPDSIFWGDTREEVYEQCAPIIDSVWNDKLEEVYSALGLSKLDVIIKSVTFIRADLSENIKLLASDPSYLGNLAQQDEEQRMRDLQANWNWKAAGDDMIKYEDMEAFFHNSIQQGDGVRRASADIAFTGGDNFVMWLWIGDHIQDVIVMRLDPKTVVEVVMAKLREWGVEECNFTYDMQGIGQYFKGFFKDAVPFNNQAAPIAYSKSEEEGIKYLYKDLKSQCAWIFYKAIKELNISINPSLLERKYSGNGYKDWTLERILQKERKAIRRDENSDDRGFRILTKKIAKKYVGHSPDFIESLYYVFLLSRLQKKKHGKINGLWML